MNPMTLSFHCAENCIKNQINLSIQEKFIAICMGVAIMSALFVQIIYLLITFIH